jgi:hemerythrin-like domain-containing protein
MEQSNSILNLMVAHHGLLEALLAVFKDDFRASKGKAQFALDDFQWELEKHLFSEEKVLFRLCDPKNPTLCGLVLKLEREHETMLGMVMALKDNLLVKTEEDITKFQDFMVQHRDVEEKELYVHLDSELTENAKREIIRRINEVPIKG